MAFTIPYLTDNKLNSVQTRAGDAAAMAEEDENEVKFHRHCQKTVLSAFGPDGQGLTWNILTRNNFSNLPSDWETYFTANRSNITEDLEAILKLINWSAGQKGSFTLSFKDMHNNSLGDANINLNSVGGTYTIKFGRRIDLKFNSSDSMKFSFSTMKAGLGGTETLNIPLKNLIFKFKNESGNLCNIQTLMADNNTVEIPKSTLKVKSGGTPSVYLYGNNSYSNEGMATFASPTEKSYEINLSLDRNRIFSTNAKEGANFEVKSNATVPVRTPASRLVPSGSTLPADTVALWIIPQWDWHVERVEVTDSAGGGNFSTTDKILATDKTNIYLNFDVRNWGRWKDSISFGQTIYEIEVHIRNNKSSTIAINNLNNTWMAMPPPSEWNLDESSYANWYTKSLTDKTTIESGYTNVYVYRFDFFKKRIINSLAYTFI